MIDPKDILSLNFYKYNKPFTGSDTDMRYRIIREGDLLKAWVWPEPYSFDATPAEQKTEHTEPFSEEGRLAVVEWLNEERRNNFGKI
ncbi:MAG: hypothetical protein K5637_00945 [Lachnospiraceae bacterium]|nr:hypothetical protein [Lachnospiraceae bacterium]